MYTLGFLLLIIGVVRAAAPPCQIGCNGDPNAISLPCGDPCPKTCENKDNPYQIPCRNRCIKDGCKCKKGYILNKAKRCIPIKNCPVYCKGPNEFYSECASSCPPRCYTTDAKNPNKNCVKAEVCRPGCECLPGYVRDLNMKCVLSHQCPPFKCTDPNQEYSKCGPGCLNTCRTIAGERQFCFGLCVQSCICKKGLVRDDNNRCIEPRLCPKKCYGENVEYKTCGTACPKTCANRNLKIICEAKCVPGCFCKTGYVLNSERQCVLPENCPVEKQCTGKNEEYSVCGRGKYEKSCENYGKPTPDDVDCIDGCVCNKYYVRNREGVCVKPTECKNNVCSGKNEAYTDCVSPCGETCATLGTNITCNFLVCNPGCDCKTGFYRNSKNICVKENECDGPKRCKENEVWSKCGNNACRNTCELPRFEIFCKGICIPGCICKPGYLLNYERRCVLPKDCDCGCSNDE